MSDNLQEVIEASRQEPKYELTHSVCENCGKKISIPAFQGERYCSIYCKRELGLDISSVGTYMFVTTEERRMILDARAAGKS